MEHATPEAFWVDKTQCRHTDRNGQLQNPNQPTCAEGISAVKAQAIAQVQGQRIYTITPENRATALPQLRIGGPVGDEIRNAIQAGKEVTIHESPITAHGWTGYGYIILDPETGAGAYLIEGGGNGSILMLIGIGYMITALILVIAVGAFGGGIALLTVGTVAFAQFMAFIASGVSIFLAGLALALGSTKACSAFVSVYAGASVLILIRKFKYVYQAIAGGLGDLISGYVFSDYCT